MIWKTRIPSTAAPSPRLAVFLVYPTDSGRAAKAAAVRILDEQQRRFLAPLTPASRTQLATLFKRLTATDSQRRDSDAAG